MLICCEYIVSLYCQRLRNNFGLLYVHICSLNPPPLPRFYGNIGANPWGSMVGEETGVPSMYHYYSQDSFQHRNTPASFHPGQLAQDEPRESADGPTSLNPSPTEAQKLASRRAQAAAHRGRVNQVKKHTLKRGLNHGVEPTDGREEEDETPKINLGAPSKTLKGGARSAKNALQVRDTYIH